jgi:hypothetical protein
LFQPREDLRPRYKDDVDLAVPAVSRSFSRASRRTAPEFTSQTCRVIAQPRLVAHSRSARFCISRVCRSCVETRAHSPARNILADFWRWPKNLVDLAVFGARLAAICEVPFAGL